MNNIKEKQEVSANWFRNLRDQICTEFEKIESEFGEENFSGAQAPSHPSGNGSQILNSSGAHAPSQPKFARKKWDREGGGGGEISIMKGNVFEKVGVNISTVFGEFSEEFRKQIPGAEENPEFFATGISLVAHMSSPLVPAVHMNTRFICTQKNWFGGGADLNPMYENEQDTKDFHNALKQPCDKYEVGAYEKYKKNCDEYFFNKHRNAPRGVGGIFYDYLNSGDFNKDFDFTKNVGRAFLEIYPALVRRHMHEKFTEEQREHQLRKRGHYAEFNLVYDRGTKFGLMTGGNVDAILMSLPPIAKWD